MTEVERLVERLRGFLAACGDSLTPEQTKRLREELDRAVAVAPQVVDVKVEPAKGADPGLTDAIKRFLEEMQKQPQAPLAPLLWPQVQPQIVPQYPIYPPTYPWDTIPPVTYPYIGDPFPGMRPYWVEYPIGDGGTFCGDRTACAAGALTGQWSTPGITCDNAPGMASS